MSFLISLNVTDNLSTLSNYPFRFSKSHPKLYNPVSSPPPALFKKKEEGGRIKERRGRRGWEEEGRKEVKQREGEERREGERERTGPSSFSLGHFTF